MKCPFCHEDKDRVIDSRTCEDGEVIRRRRECLGCLRRFTTYERVVGGLNVIKKDRSREPFDRMKIKKGLEKACWKRPISDSQLEEIVSTVQEHVENHYEVEVESDVIGELVMEHLRDLDQVAYVRFASVYRQFEDVQDFVKELRPMLADTSPAR